MREAFYNDVNLKTINLPEGLETIGAYAFRNNKSLKTITIPSTVTFIDNHAFTDCVKLATVTMKVGDNTLASDMEKAVFENCTALTKITIPGRFNSIPSYAFLNCTSLKEVSYGTGVYNYPYQRIDYQAFKNCSALNKVTLKKTVESIDRNAFEATTALTGITLPEGITSIGNYAFYNSGLKKIAIPSTVVSIGSGAFASCKKLASATFEEGMEPATIGDRAFQYCIALTKITIPGNYQEIYSYAFEGDTKLQSFLWKPATMTLVEDTQFLGYRAFYNCSNLTSVALSKDVTSMESYIFDGCNSKLIIEGTSKSTTAKDYAGGYSIKFTTGIAAPAYVKASVGSANKVKISWNSVAGASKYILYKKTSKGYTKVAETTSTSYEVSFDNTKAYTYRVKAYGKVLGSSNKTSDYSDAIKVGVSLATPSSLKATSKNYKTINLKWDKVKGATGYYIYQKTGSDWKKVKTVKGASNTSAELANLTCGKKYTYTIKAYYVDNDIYSYSKYNTKGVSVKVALPATKITSIGNTSKGKIKVTWKKVSGATGYQVYRRTGNSGSYKVVKTISSGKTVSYTDTNRTKGKTYYYKIVAIRKTSSGTVKSSVSNVKNLKVTK